MKIKLLKGIILLSILTNIFSSILNANLRFEYPYSCGTWFNRGKNTCHAIIDNLEKNNISVTSSIKGYHMGEFPKEFNGDFNIYIKKNNRWVLLATSDSNSNNYQSGLKYFAYTFYKIDEKNGEKNYLEEFPQKHELLDFVLKRTVEILKSNNLR